MIETSLPISSESDIVACRKLVRDLVGAAGFGVTDVTRIVTSVSELARNIYVYAKRGEMQWKLLQQPEKVGIELIFVDRGPGIANIEQAMQPGYTTAKSLGMGLPGVKRLMDDMEVRSELGVGTTVVIRKWTKSK